MPTYLNNSTSTIHIANIEFPPGVIRHSFKYVNHANLIIQSDNPRVFPFRTLHNDTIANIPGAGITGMENFQFMTIQNLTGALITITPNEDSANIMEISNDQSITFEIDNDWRRIDIAGAGGAKVNVYVSNERRK